MPNVQMKPLDVLLASTKPSILTRALDILTRSFTNNTQKKTKLKKSNSCMLFQGSSQSKAVIWQHTALVWLLC